MIDRVLYDILLDALNNNASDVHLSAGCLPMLRIDGQIMPLTAYDEMDQTLLNKMAGSLLTPMQVERYTAERELDFSFAEELGSRGMQRFRANLAFEKGVQCLQFVLFHRQCALSPNSDCPSKFSR